MCSIDAKEFLQKNKRWWQLRTENIRKKNHKRKKSKAKREIYWINVEGTEPEPRLTKQQQVIQQPPALENVIFTVSSFWSTKYPTASSYVLFSISQYLPLTSTHLEHKPDAESGGRDEGSREEWGD